MRIAAYVPDLMDRSRFAGLDVTFVAAPGDLAAADADVYVIDVGRAGALDAVVELAEGGSRRIIGFGSHVDDELLAAARQAGCTEVLPRSRFFKRLHQL